MEYVLFPRCRHAVRHDVFVEVLAGAADVGQECSKSVVLGVLPIPVSFRVWCHPSKIRRERVNKQSKVLWCMSSWKAWIWVGEGAGQGERKRE